MGLRIFRVFLHGPTGSPQGQIQGLHGTVVQSAAKRLQERCIRCEVYTTVEAGSDAAPRADRSCRPLTSKRGHSWKAGKRFSMASMADPSSLAWITRRFTWLSRKTARQSRSGAAGDLRPSNLRRTARKSAAPRSERFRCEFTKHF